MGQQGPWAPVCQRGRGGGGVGRLEGLACPLRDDECGRSVTRAPHVFGAPRCLIDVEGCRTSKGGWCLGSGAVPMDRGTV